MIKHNALEDRLNAVREGKPIPPVPTPIEIIHPEQDKPKTASPIYHKEFLISESYKLFNVLATSLLYGFGINAIFSTDWSFMGSWGVGFLLNHSLTIILKLLKK